MERLRPPKGKIQKVGLRPCKALGLFALSLGFAVVFLQACFKHRENRIEQVASFKIAGWAHDLAFDGGQLYVASRQGGFFVFDRNGSDLKPLRVVLPVTDVISLAPNGGNPLLASRFEGLVLVSSLGRVLSRFSNGDIANSVAVRDKLAYSAFGKHGLMVARLEGESIRVIAELPTPGWSHDIKLRGDRAFVADWDYGLRVVDIRNAEKPEEVGVLPTAATAICVALNESKTKPMAALAEGHAGVAIVALDDSGRPSLLARNPLGLKLSDPPHPESGGWAHGVAWKGRYVFVANWKRGLVVVDAEDARNPRILLEHATDGTALGVAAAAQPDGSYLIFLADGEGGLKIFRFSPGIN